MKIFNFIFVLLLVALFGCNCDSTCKYYRGQEQDWYADNGKIKVLSTTAMIHDLVKHIGAEHIDGLVLIRGELDPHTYQMVKGDDENLLMQTLRSRMALVWSMDPASRST